MPNHHWIRKLLRFWTPHGLVEMRRAAIAKSTSGAERARFHAQRCENIRLAQSQNGEVATPEFTFEGAISFLKERGLDEFHLREGTIPPSSLNFLVKKLHEQNWAHTHHQIVALHVGNFVGVSLAALASTLRNINLGSLVIAVDPNIPHRGIAHPQDHALALLGYFGLLRNVLLLVGYSSAKSVSNDGVIFDKYNPVVEFKNEVSCENVVENLRKIMPSGIHFAIIDGNHAADYLHAEIEQVARILVPGGIVALDDVDEYWSELRDVYRSLAGSTWQDLGTDGRVGLLKAPLE